MVMWQKGGNCVDGAYEIFYLVAAGNLGDGMSKGEAVSQRVIVLDIQADLLEFHVGADLYPPDMNCFLC